MRRLSVLIIAYYFPPWGGGPVLRALKLVKYLQRINWQVCVLTAQPHYYEAVSDDPELLAEAGPAARIVRTRSLHPTGTLARGMVAESVGASRSNQPGARILMRLARLAHQLLVPDDKLLWLPFALRAGLLLARERRFDVIFVTAPPHSTCLLGLALHRLTGIPLVVDLRDDWIGNPLYKRSWGVRKRIEAAMERRVVHAASAIVVPTDPSCRALADRYRGLADRLHVIPNGFDEEDIERARLLPPTGRREPNYAASIPVWSPADVV